MRNPNASTLTQESSRVKNQKDDRGIFRSLQQKLGTIIEVHKTLPLVKVRFNGGSIAASGNWIGVSHSVLDIIHRFGALRIGLKVKVIFSGEAESSAMVEIIGVEGEKLGVEILQDNNFDSGTPWELMTPGAG